MAGTFDWAGYTAVDMAIDREEIDSVQVQTAESQTEVRTAWAPGVLRYRYRFKITGRKNLLTDEVEALRDFYALQGGKLDSFTMEDPVDGADVTVRFDSPLQMRRVMPQWWECTFSLITVVNPT